YLRLSRRMPVQTIVRMGFAVLVMSGVMLVFFGDRSPWLFAACAAVATLSVVGLRVPGTNLILEQQQRDTGSAVALVHFITSMFGAMAVQLVAAHSGNMTSTLGGLFMVVGLLCGVM
ncbi:hypothetical protein Q4595_22305, partial [Wenyingzhuangia sp. 1_MG-2023]|nr:hypothetical protein [Wenyingzhuangia sp. 1_MG-2023]